MSTDLLRLLCIVASALTSGMSIVMLAHVAMYGRSRYRIPAHIVPLAASYTLLTLLICWRTYKGFVVDGFILSILLLSLCMGIYGLGVALRSWVARDHE